MKKRGMELNASVIGAASVVGYKEHEGPLGNLFDYYDDKKNGGDRFGQDTFEKAENEMQRIALNTALEKGGVREEALGALFAGDLLNQCVGSAYGLLDFNVPYFGLYGACSTAAEGLMLAAALVTHDVYDCCGAVASSHNCTAERQYRTPLEYGGQRPPTAQWTVTGAGAFILGKPREACARITYGMPGIAMEKGISDTANMGAAMAPAAADTLLRYLDESGREASDFDLIATGDLGTEGGAILCDLMRERGYDIRENYNDCGEMIYCRHTQDVHAGGSGCGCSAVVSASYLIPKLARGELRRILLIGTGAMMSPDSIKQGQTIPAIAHLLVLESPSAGASPTTGKEQ